MTPSDDGATPDVGDDEVRRLHPLTPFFDLVLLARQFALPLLLTLFANRDRGQAFLAAPALVGSLVGVVRWWRFRYTIDGGRLLISEGLLTRKERIVPLDRIQQVDLEARLRHRILGVVVLKIDTAGGTGGAEVDLSVVSAAEGARLREVLLTAAPSAVAAGEEPGSAAGPAATSGAGEAAVPSQALVRLDLGRLMLAGVTGAELAVMSTIVGWAVQFGDDLPRRFLEDRTTTLRPPTGAAGYALGITLLAVVWLGLAAAASVLKNANYALSRRGGDLHVSRGLFDRRELTVPARRVQNARVHETALRRLLGMGGVRLRSTAGMIDVPLLTRPEWQALLDEVMPGDRPQELEPAPPPARRRAWVRRLGPAIALGGAAAAWRSELRPLVPVLVAGAAVGGELSYRGLGHGWRGGFVVARAGGVRRETYVVSSAKVQSTRLRTSPLQRRSGLATLWIDVAGGGAMPVIRDADADALRALQAEVLTDATRLDEVAARRAVGRGRA